MSKVKIFFQQLLKTHDEVFVSDDDQDITLPILFYLVRVQVIMKQITRLCAAPKLLFLTNQTDIEHYVYFLFI
jgi:hypothetical protein